MKTEKRPLLLSADDWEAFYYGGDLITEGHRIDRLELLDLADQFDFTRGALVTAEVSSRDWETVDRNGRFPERLSELQDQYY
jgi:hypothetical protein